MNNILLSTPIEDCFQLSLYAIAYGEKVVLFRSSDGCQLDEFTLDEYTLMISEGTLNRETRRLTVNW